MRTLLKNSAKKLVLAITFAVGTLGIGVPTIQSQTVPRMTLCEDTGGWVYCDSFGSSAGYFRYRCNYSGYCEDVTPNQ
jgi:hypothetical protein